MPRNPDTTARLVAAVAVLGLAAAILAASLIGGGAQPGPATSTSLPVLTTTSTTIAGVVSTGSGPSAFTTTSAPGPIQVIVEAAACVRYVGDGWRVRWRIHNRGPTVSGPLVGRVDDGEPTVLAPSLRVERGATVRATSVVGGGGDAIILTFITPAREVSSFPIETPDCPTDPADEEAAEQVTTTLATP
jgi:hypothetical protein